MRIVHLVIASVLLLSSPVKAELLALTLDEAIANALKNAPASARIAWDMADGQARAREWEMLPNPEIQLDSIYSNTEGNDGAYAEMTQPLQLSHFGERQALADSIRQTAALEGRVQMLSVAHDVTRRYLDLWLLQKHAEFLKENLKFARVTNETVRNAARSGELQVAESYLFQAETLKFQEELGELETAAKTVQLDFLRQLGMEAVELTLAYPTPPALPAKASDLVVRGEASPLRMLELRGEETARRLAVVKTDAYLPEISPRLHYSQGYDSDHEEAGVGMRLTLPLWNRSEPEISRLEAEKHFIDASLAAYRRVGYGRLLESQYNEAVTAVERLKRYEQEILPAYEKSFSAARDMFGGGQISVLQLWQVHERLHEVQLKTLEIRKAAFESVMELETLMGQALEGGVK